MMSGFLKFAFVLGMCAVAVTAKSVQIQDVESLEMTAEEEEFFLKMMTVAQKANYMYGLSSDAPLYNRQVTGYGECSVTGDVGTCSGGISVPIDVKIWKTVVKVDAVLTVDYIPENYGVYITLVINGDTVIDQEVSARNPPSLCVGVATFLTVCLQLSDIVINGNDYHACFGIYGRVAFLDVAHLNLGCLDI
ncbi:uncharacterized protein [Asterias amurensis]|uniref:uncharacterized protein n=1 Tax=Asterias amurensis TaxID=7602 RepID=UPI003AB86885